MASGVPLSIPFSWLIPNAKFPQKCSPKTTKLYAPLLKRHLFPLSESTLLNYHAQLHTPERPNEKNHRPARYPRPQGLAPCLTSRNNLPVGKSTPTSSLGAG